jgi:hypothetical protein
MIYIVYQMDKTLFMDEIDHKDIICKYDVIPSSLIDSYVSLKLKSWKNKELDACSLAHSTLEVKGCAGVPG